MRHVMAAVGLVASALAAQAEEQIYSFIWEGAGGYSVEGALAFDAAALPGPLVMEENVTCFEITGFLDGNRIGRWALGMLAPDTDWRLHFVPAESAFVVEGQYISMPQAWNMNGAGNSCGVGGFGLNIGNLGQDLCLDGAPLWDSQVAPDRPFPAQRDDGHRFGNNACRPAMLLGALTPPAVAAGASR